MSNHQSNWLEKLFLPHFTVDGIQELLFLTQKKPAKSFSDLIALKEKITLDDIEKIENIYERVWFKNALEKQLKIETDENKQQASQDKYIQTDISTFSTNNYLDKNNHITEVRKLLQTSKTKCATLAAENRVFKENALHFENRIQSLTKENSFLKTNCHKLTASNERLSILSSNLEQQLKITQNRCKELQSVIREKNDHLLEVRKETYQVVLRSDKKRIQEENEYQQLMIKNQYLETELSNQKEIIKSEYDIQTDQFKEKINSHKILLQDEVESHRRTKKALDHLRKHFINSNHDKQTEQSKQSYLYQLTY